MQFPLDIGRVGGFRIPARLQIADVKAPVLDKIAGLDGDRGGVREFGQNCLRCNDCALDDGRREAMELPVYTGYTRARLEQRRTFMADEPDVPAVNATPNKLAYEMEVRKYWDAYAQKAIKEAQDVFARELTFYKYAFLATIGIGSALLALGGWMGFSNIKTAEAYAIDKIKQEMATIASNAKFQVQRTIEDQLKPDVLTKAAEHAAQELTKAGGAQDVLKIFADQTFVRLDKKYTIRNDSSGLNLDVDNAGQDRKRPVTVWAFEGAKQSWVFIPQP